MSSVCGEGREGGEGEGERYPDAHLKLCQQRIEQALEMLERYPDVECKVRPEIGQ